MCHRNSSAAVFKNQTARRFGASISSTSQSPPPAPVPDAPALFTTYHPLLVESHFSVLLGHLLLGDFPALLPAFARAAALVDGLEGYPVFLPPRSMAQAEFVEILERLAGGWRAGTVPPAGAAAAARGRLAIEAPPPSPRSLKAKEVDRVPTPPSPEPSDGPRGSGSGSGSSGAPAPTGSSSGAGMIVASVQSVFVAVLAGVFFL